MGERCPGTPGTARPGGRGHAALGTAGDTAGTPAGGLGRDPQGSGGAGRGRGGLLGVATLSLALLFLRAEAEGFALCAAPALQTKVFQYW